MVKNVLLIIGLLFISFQGISQTYGNEWIRYDQTYYKFKVLSTGFHKIDYNHLVNAGIPVSTFSPANMQVIGREKELPLLIVDGGDNSFDNGDYILFYAERNNGWLDSTLYQNPDDIGNPDYSLYNDTIYYFFSWNSSINNLRYTEETDTDYSSYTPAKYIWWESSVDFHSNYYEGRTIASLSTSFFTIGEGYSRSKVTGPAVVTNNFNTNFRYLGPDSPLSTFIGKSGSSNNPSVSSPLQNNHHLKWQFGSQDTVLLDTSFLNIVGINFRADFPTGSLNSSNTPFKWYNVGDLPSGNDLQTVSYFSLRYPRLPALNSFPNGKFDVVNESGQSKIRLDITNLTGSNVVAFVHGDVPRKLLLSPSGSDSYQTLIPNSSAGSSQTVYYGSLNSAISASPLSLVNSNGTFTNFAALQPDSALLMVYHSILTNAKDSYVAYRSSAPGGAYNIVQADIDELYLQYGGGIPKHINGVRRWAKQMYDQSQRLPAALFLMGKGVREAPIESYPFNTPGTRTNTAFYAQSLIPSFGQPSSDIAITASWLPNNWTPLIPTGRISVNTNEELQNYLDKIIEFDAQQDQNSIYDFASKDWQKQVLHFGGGSNAQEQSLFRSYLEQMENTIESAEFAGNVTKLYKVNSDPFDPALYNEITNRLSTGVSLINFFGHANPATNGFEINIENPSNWNNPGKYPIVIANTCLNGNIFHRETANDFSTSETFVRAENAGAIAFISAVYLGFSNTLANYTNGLYKQFSQLGYGLPLGKQIQQNIKILENNLSDYLLESNALQMSLNGDPLIKLNYHNQPEIDITDNNLTFSPAKIDLTVDSITVSLEIRNLGRAITDTFSVEIIRDFPQASIDSVYVVRIPELNYSHTLNFKMPLQPNIGVGLNKISINVDIPSFIDENYDEINNNRLTKNLLINIDGILPISPRRYAVVPRDSVVFKASTIDPLAAINTYLFELDTTDLFNSPFRKFAKITSIGGVKEVYPNDWKTNTGGNSPFTATDSSVYFWRVAIDDGNFDWKESSFQYIIGKSGWGQDHFFQFKENNFNHLSYNRPSRDLSYPPLDTVFVEIHSNGPSFSTGSNDWQISGIQQDYEICSLTPSIHVGVVDPVTFQSWGTRVYNNGNVNDIVNPDHGFGNANDLNGCRTRQEKYFIFRQNSLSQLQAFQNMVLNEVPDGHYIIIYTPYNGARFDLWNAIDSANMYNTFATLGTDSIIPGQTNAPFAYFVRKGFPQTKKENLAQTLNEAVYLKAGMVGNESLGAETSTLVGPASKWGAFYWKIDSKETLPGDTTFLEIDTYNSAQQLQSTLSVPLASTDSILQLGNLINATTSPYLRLRAIFVDSTFTTPGQLDRWHVLYDELPEAAIDGTNGYYWTGLDTLNEGEKLRFAIDVRNVYDVAMDSILISYYVEDKYHFKHYLDYPRQDSLRINQTLRDTVEISTVGLSGTNVLWMEVNPYTGPNNSLDQPEQFHFNNLLQLPFCVRGDNQNPLLDVTFDGRHILNRDIVNPNAEILISLKDENPYLIMNDISDTTFFGVYLTGPDGVQKRIPFEANGQTVMQWFPADGQTKKFKILYPAAFEEDGLYTLSVQGADRSGNLSGDMDYRITFEVIRESSITYLMNYPNPFSTSTRFVFTLTGSEVPDDLIIQIMTISGKVVREITESQFGPIYIGRNISEYAWDGTDEFGDRLANGVYLYRVKIRMNGEEIKHRESGADSHFTKEFGKMYLMR